jgi:hypothetical protein
MEAQRCTALEMAEEVAGRVVEMEERVAQEVEEIEEVEEVKGLYSTPTVGIRMTSSCW